MQADPSPSPNDQREERAAEWAARYGFSNDVAGSLATLLDVPIFAVAVESVLEALGRSANPVRAIRALETAIQRLESTRGDASALLVRPVLELVLEIAGASPKGARVLANDPALAIAVGARFQQDRTYTRADFSQDLVRIITAAQTNTDDFDRRIRKYRNRQMLRIAWRELREVSVRQTSAELADLASALLQAALEHHGRNLLMQVGVPTPSCAHAIIGMGKLGGRELNFSSDVDLIYFYEHDEGGVGELTMHQFHVKLFERVTSSLARITEHGFVFRIDLDLRPEGRKGPLANSLPSAERYYQTWGRTWERAAWIKARPVAGDPEFGERVLEMMRPFVYRKSLDDRAIEELIEMKSRIDQQRRKHSGRKRRIDLKLGSGGIREIEFFVQAHQLLHGGRNIQLQHANTLEALSRIEAAGLGRPKTIEAMIDTYLLLRRIEHRVQLVEEQQTHELPEDSALRAEIARSLGLASVSEMERLLERRMRQVHKEFVQMLGLARDIEPVSIDIQHLFDLTLHANTRRSALVRLGSKDAEMALASFDAACRHASSPFHPNAEPRQRRVAQKFVAECAASSNLDRALRHLPDLVRTLIIHGSYLEVLERPALRRGIARVLGASDLLARILVSQPALLPRVLLPESLPRIDAVARDLDARLLNIEDVEVRAGILRSAKQEETLRAAMADMAGLIDTEAVNERLTKVAECLIERALTFALEEMEARYGAVEAECEDGSGLVVVAGGSLGAFEMGYRTDLDLWIIFSGEGETVGGERERIACAEFYTRVGQRFVTLLTARTREGDLYPVDLRLRPSGSKGPLVVSLRNFEQYHADSAQLWERQALLRARTVAGTAALRARVEEAITRAAYEGPPIPNLAEKIHEMRTRIERERSVSGVAATEASKPRRQAINLKLGPGGLIEAEFLVQYLLLTHGRRDRSLRTTSTRKAIAGFVEAGVLTRRAAEEVRAAYDRLKKLHNWLRLVSDEMIDHLSLDSESSRVLARAVGYRGDDARDQLEQALHSDTQKIHLCYREALGLSGA